MGLEITVGALADLRQNDPEGVKWLRKELELVSEVMVKSGLQPHREPEDAQIWFASGYGYSGLHKLREIAGLHWMGKEIPCGRLNDDIAAEDALFYAALQRLQPTILQRFVSLGKSKSKLPFVHLIAHSDAAGYYVPTNFEFPLIPKRMEESTAHIWPLGSVQQLAGEVGALIELLKIPIGVDQYDERLLSRLETGNDETGVGALWEFHPIAAFTALILKEACEASLQSGAAIQFS